MLEEWIMEKTGKIESKNTVIEEFSLNTKDQRQGSKIKVNITKSKVKQGTCSVSTELSHINYSEFGWVFLCKELAHMLKKNRCAQRKGVLYSFKSHKN